MLTLCGKFNSANVFVDKIEDATISQIISMCNSEALAGNIIRIMPDCHPGKGCTIGTTIKINNGKIIPNLVGSDIGCGVLCGKVDKQRIDLPKFDSIVQHYKISISQYMEAEELLGKLLCKKNIYLEKALNSFGTLGGGNHFIELDKDSSGDVYLVIHSGSRRLGMEVCKYYQEKAYKNLKSMGYSGSEFMAYVEGALLKDYLYDMQLATKFAKLNRYSIATSILKASKIEFIETIDSIHNYIDAELVLRKGAISAKSGEALIIPINMRDGTLICTGKGNSEWNFSAPHGAGRILSRSEIKDCVSFSEYKSVMSQAGVYSSTITRGTLDECPMAYKSIEVILENISDTASVDKVLKPIYNFKNSDSKD